MMTQYTSEKLRRLVRPGRVHRSLYTDPEIFALEMERIFGRTWIYVGHESQIPNPGDFVTTRIGLKPMVLSRHSDGTVHVIHNQCAHRGAQVVAAEQGNSREFRCCYHGWSYHTDGRLKQVPLRHAYPENFNPSGMPAAARVESYRGFVFASLASQGPSLREFLGPVAQSFDDMVDRAPEGEIEVAGGVFKHVYNGNWKLYLENLLDAAHPLFVHQSSIEAAKVQDDSVPSDGTGEIAIRQMRQNGASYGFWESQVGIWSYPNGHGYLGDYHDDAKLVAAMNDPIFREYRAALEAKKGVEEARRILEVRRWNTNVYPNVSFMSQFQQFRVVHPLAPARTVVYTYNFRLKGAPPQMFRNAVAFANIVNGTGSLVLTDDLETYNRIGMGFASEGPEWIEISRGIGTDEAEPGGGRRGKNSTSEVYLRNMFDAWLGYMTAEEARLGAAAE
jgi:phenylpropionate dioxygenase-like ring-hydroxylating dioxygenase large terminal subunit